MKTLKITVGSIFAVLLFAAFSCAGEGGAVASLKEGKTLFEKKCKLCHSLRIPLGKTKSRDEWKLSVKRMVTYGASLNAVARENVVGYLTARSDFEQSCGSCHEAVRVVPDDDVRRDWKKVLARMSTHIKELEEKGMAKGQGELDEEKIEGIAAFLTVIIDTE